MRELWRCVLATALIVLAGLLPRWNTGHVMAASARHEKISCVFDHTMLRTAPGTCRPRARVYPPGVQSKVQRAIYDSSLLFGVPYGVLLRIARCESGLNPKAAYAGHFGLFQFLPATFHGGARDMRTNTGVTARTLWSASDASYVAGYLFAVGQSPRWSCEPPI